MANPFRSFGGSGTIDAREQAEMNLSAVNGTPDWPETNGNRAETLPPTPTPKQSRTPRLRLERITDCKRELAQLYRAARRGEISTQTATRLAYLLDLMSRMVERSELERRVEQLEAERSQR